MTIEDEDMERGSLSPTATPSTTVVEEQHTPDEAVPTRRLVIREMVLENFKSYAGAQRVGPFHKVRWGTVFVGRHGDRC